MALLGFLAILYTKTKLFVLICFFQGSLLGVDFYQVDLVSYTRTYCQNLPGDLLLAAN